MLGFLRRLVTRLFGGRTPAPSDKYWQNLRQSVGGPAARTSSESTPWNSPDPLPGVRSLDSIDGGQGKMMVLVDSDSDLLIAIEERVLSGKLSLSQLPSTSVAIMELSAKPNADVSEIVERLEPDPVLCTELLRTANSVLYATRVKTDSIRDAVMRLGTRNLRTMILGLSMRNTMIRSKALQRFGEKVWRQAFTVGTIARAIGPDVRINDDHAFLLGLLHDIGKVALLDTLSQLLEDETDATPALVGRMFLELHEEAGRAMAETWGLDAEIISVAGSHHGVRSNEEFPQSAALVSLCHRMELLLSLDATNEYQELIEADEFEVLGVAPAQRARVLALGLRAYLTLHPVAPADDAPAGDAPPVGATTAA